MRRALDGIYAAGAVLGGLCLIGIVLLIIAQVASRWMAVPITGAPEFAGYAMANSFFLPLAYAFRKESHIRISVLIDRIAGSWRWTVETICLGVGFGLAGCLAIFMFRLAQVSYKINDLSQGADATPLWVPQTGVAIGSILFAAALADTLIEHLLVARRQPISEWSAMQLSRKHI